MSAPADPHIAPAAGARGVQRFWDPRVWGTIIGAAGASVFVLANRGELPWPWPTAALLAWALALAAYLWFVLVARRDFGPMAPVGGRAGPVYLASVGGMLLLIRVGTAFLDARGESDLRPAVIVVAVGLHFLPFAAVFHTPMFALLGALMTTIGSLGLVLGWLADPRWAAAAAVLTGVVMLAVIAVDAAPGVRPDRGR